MKNPRLLWKHEVIQADKVARSLVRMRKVKSGWGVMFIPNWFYEMVHCRRNLAKTRKNLLFTRQKAFKAAKEIMKGEDRSLQIGVIEIETRDLLDREKKGYYTDKVRRKQIQEIEVLIDHFLALLRTESRTNDEAIGKAYPTQKQYLSFLRKLERAEEEVIRVSIDGVRAGSKKERVAWFQKVQDTTRRIRSEETKRFFPEEKAGG